MAKSCGICLPVRQVHEATGKIYVATFGWGIWVADLAIDAANGINEVYKADICLSPNRASKEATITIEHFEGKQFLPEIIGITGKHIRKETLHVNQAIFQKSYNLSQFRAGLYFIRLSYGKASQVKRLLINR